MSKIQLSKTFILNSVKLALNEDLYPSGDITSRLVENDKSIKIKLIANQNAIVGGLLFTKQAFYLNDQKIKFTINFILLSIKEKVCLANNNPATIAF